MLLTSKVQKATFRDVIVIDVKHCHEALKFINSFKLICECALFKLGGRGIFKIDLIN